MCDVYYGDGFDDYLKQAESVYPNLDLSKITIDDIVLQTLGGDDTVNDKPDDFVHTIEQEAKDDSMVIAQPVLKGPVILVASSIEGGQDIVNLSAPDAPPSQFFNS